MRKYIFIIAFSLFTILSCIVGRREGTVQKADASYLHFTTLNDENLKSSLSLLIDDAQPFAIEIDQTTNRNTRFTNKKLYQITPGKHTIKVYKNGNLTIDKLIYVGNQETVEIDIK
jgi:hypothetical protein